MEKTCGIFIIDNNKNILICRATGTDSWSIPKGHPEIGESFIEAAIRETLEETGINLKDKKDLLTLIGSEIYKSKKKKLISYYLKIDNIDFKKLKCTSFFANNKPEIAEYKIVNYDEAMVLIHETQKKLLLQIKEIF